MRGHLAAVAVGSARTELSANIRLMTRFFEQGVPADDDTCVRMMRSLPECGLGEIRLDISTEFCVELSLLAAGVARDYDENRLDDPDVVHAFPACDAYGEDEKALRADFYGKVGKVIREVGSIRCRATLSDSLFAMCAPRPALCETLVCARGAQSEQRLGCACRMHPTAASAASQWQYSAIGNDQSGTGSPSVGIAFRPSSPIYSPLQRSWRGACAPGLKE